MSQITWLTKNKGQAPKSKKYRGKKTQTKSQGPVTKANTKFKGRCSELEDYIFNLGMRALSKFSGKMKEPEHYLGVTYSNSCQPAIMTNTLATFPDPYIPKIVPDTGAKRPKTDMEITYLKKKTIDRAIRQKLRNKDVYETDMQNIYNLIIGQTNKQLQEKAASVATFQAVKTGQNLIGYLIILKNLCFSNQSEQHPIRSLCLSIRRLYNTMKYASDNTTYYLVRFCNAHKVN